MMADVIEFQMMDGRFRGLCPPHPPCDFEFERKSRKIQENEEQRKRRRIKND